MKYKTHKAWLEYVRTDCGITKIESKNAHNNLRKVTSLYFKMKDTKPFDEITASEDIVFNNYKSKQIKEAIQSLSTIERKLLELTTGINFDTFETTEKLSYNKTALLLGMTESAVQKKRKRILKKLKQMLKNS